MSDRPLRDALAESDKHVYFAMAVAAVLGFARLDHAPLWFDETYTATWMSGSWRDTLNVILRGDYGANHLPLYFLMLKAWTVVAGTSAFALRALSVAFHLLAIVYIGALARVSAGPRAEPAAAWLAAFSPFLLHHAHEARMYTMIVCLCAMSLYLVARYLAGQTRQLPFSLLLINLALVETHHYAPIFLAGEFLSLLLLRWRDWRNWLPLCFCNGLFALVPLTVALFVAQHEAGASYEIGWAAVPGSLWVLFSGYGLIPNSMELHDQGIAAIGPYLPAVVAGGIAAGTLLAHGIVGTHPKHRLMLVVVPAVALIGPFLATLVWPLVNFNPRYASIGLAPLLVLTARAISGGPKPMVRISAVVLMSLALVSVARESLEPGFDREDMVSAGRWLDAHVPAGETILITSDEMEVLARFHWPRFDYRLYPEHTVQAVGEAARRVAADVPFTHRERVYYVLGRAWLTSPDGSLQRELRRQYGSCGTFSARGIEVLCLQTAAVRR